MNDVLKTILNRRSYRNFVENHKLNQEELDLILAAAKQAPSSMNIQQYSIIVIEDQKQKDYIKSLMPFNPQIATCSVFLIFVADFYRGYLASQKYGFDFVSEGNSDMIMRGTVDAALAMQNATLAAEALGYGSVCIGTVPFSANEISELCELPDYTYPICGLCIGKVEDPTTNEVKPRYSKNVFYGKYDTDQSASMDAYDEVLKQFANNRISGIWSEKVGSQFQKQSDLINNSLKAKKF